MILRSPTPSLCAYTTLFQSDLALRGGRGPAPPPAGTRRHGGDRRQRGHRRRELGLGRRPRGGAARGAAPPRAGTAAPKRKRLKSSHANILSAVLCLIKIHKE